MKKKITSIALIAAAITVFGVLLDGDIQEPELAVRCFEFIAMTVIVFTAIALPYFAGKFVIGNVYDS